MNQCINKSNKELLKKSYNLYVMYKSAALIKNVARLQQALYKNSVKIHQ